MKIKHWIPKVRAKNAATGATTLAICFTGALDSGALA